MVMYKMWHGALITFVFKNSLTVHRCYGYDLMLEDSEEVRYHIQFTNDPSAGSPTETLLRLLLPLNDQV